MIKTIWLVSFNISGRPGPPAVSSYNVIETQTGVLNCVLAAQHPDNPEMIYYTWTKENKDIGFNDRTAGLLMINNTQRTDDGLYQCSVRNVAGMNSAETSLVVYCKNQRS